MTTITIHRQLKAVEDAITRHGVSIESIKRKKSWPPAVRAMALADCEMDIEALRTVATTLREQLATKVQP
jgi:hypothetical protein